MKKNVLWNTIGSIIYFMCQWLITILVVRLGNYTHAGYLSLAMTTSSSFSAISLFSMRNYQISDIRDEYSNDIYIGSRISTCVLGFLACVVFSLLNNTSSYQLLCIIAFMLIRTVEAMVDVMHGMQQKRMRYDLIGKSYTARGFITLVSFVVGMVASGDLLASLIAVVLGNALFVLVFDWGSIQRGKLVHKLVLYSPQIKKLLIICIPLVIFSFLLSFENLIPKMVLEQQVGSDKLGIYSSISSPTLIVQVFATMMFNPFLPMISNYYHNNRALFQKMMNKVLGVIVLMTLVIILGASLLGQFGLELLFGSEILEYYYLFMPIVWCTILTGIVWIFSAIVIAMRKTKLLLGGILVSFLLELAIVSPLVTYFDMNGVSIVQIIVFGVLSVYLILICKISNLTGCFICKK